jgi:hypothetical protein
MSSRERRPYVVFAFATTHEALEAEDALRAARVNVVPIPTPKTVGRLCGIAMRIDPAEESAALDAMQAAGVRVAERVDITDV